MSWVITLPARPSVWPVIVSGLLLIAVSSWMTHQGHPDRWRDFVRRNADVHALAAVLLIALAVQCADTHGVTTDGVIYFSQLRSVIFDGDLDVTAEFAFLRQPARPSHVVPIGPTFVWLPLYLSVTIVDAAGRALGLWTAPALDGLGLTLPYVRAALLSSFAIGSIGLFVLVAHLRREFAPGVAFATAFLLFAATPLVWYMVYEPSMTHAASFGFVAVFLVAAAQWTSVRMTRAHAVMLGALLGCAFMTRPQEAVFALFPAVLLLTSHASVGDRIGATARLAGWAFLGALPLLALQAIHSTALLQREEFLLIGGGGYLDLINSRWADTLWSSWHGFFSWTPVAYLAFLAMFFYAARDRGWALAAIMIVMVMAWVNGSTADWAAGWSFGGRRFTSVLAVLAPGVALILDGLTRRPMIAAGIVGASAIAWNQLLVTQQSRGMLRADAPVTFAQIIRQQAALATESPFVYPFAFPANALFAWRTGLSIEDYDLLGSEPLHGSIDLPMDAAAGRYLKDGWTGRVTDRFGALRWIEGTRAELLLPLNAAVDRNVTLTVEARTRLLDSGETATFAVIVNGREVGMLTPDTHQASTSVFTIPARSGLLSRAFNRITFERRAGTPPVGIYRIAVS